MTKEQLEIVNALRMDVSMLPGCWDKQFLRSLSDRFVRGDLSEAQTTQLNRLLYKYRKQIPGVYQKYYKK